MKRTGRPNKNEAELLLERLITTAGAHFVQRGYRCTSLEAVAIEAGVTKKTIYARFGDKAGLFEAVVRQLAGGAGKLRSVVGHGHGHGREGLIYRAEMIVEAALEPNVIALNRLLLREGLNFPFLQQVYIEMSNNHVLLPLKRYFQEELSVASEETAMAFAEYFVDVLLSRYMSLIALAEVEALREWYSPERLEFICSHFISGMDIR